MLRMATAWMINDDMKINNINPYVLSGTFGIPTDGSKWKSDGTYTIEIDDRQMVYTDVNGDLQNFSPMATFRSGPIMVGEIAAKPSPPWGTFPARKYEYDNGVVTWVRPDLQSKGMRQWASDPLKANTWDMWTVLLVIVAMALIYAALKRR
jgi:hypothetical protein